MNKMFKVMAISAVAALVFALPLAAQEAPASVAPQAVPAGAPTSNLRQSTATLYKTDVDNFLNVNNWSAVNFGSWFGFLHGTGTTENNYRANLGYATKVSDIYLGFRYNGNIFRDTGGAESVTLTPSYDEASQQLTQLVQLTTYPTDKWHGSTNQLEVLIGVAGQGIKVGFFESMAVRPTDGNRNFTTTDSQNGNIRYQNEPVEYSRFSGYMQPSVQWGTLLNVSGLTLKPRATLLFNIFQDKQIDNYYADYTAFNGKPVTARNLTVVGRNYGYLQTGIAVGADLGLPKKDDLATSFTLDYAVNFNSYNNDYSASGFEGKAKGPVSWNGSTVTTTSIAEETTVTTSTLTFGGTGTNTGYSSHTITPIVTLDKTVTDSLNLGLSVRAPITVTATSRDNYTETRTYTTVNNYDATNSADAKRVTDRTEHNPGGLTETTSFNITPSVRIGARYHLIPGRFTVNAGVYLNPMGDGNNSGWTHTTTTNSRNGDGQRITETVENGDGVVISKTDTTTLGSGAAYNDVSTVNSTWAAFTGQVGAGFLFNFNENIAMDLWANTGALSSNWSINLTTVNVMFTFKFGAKAGGNRANVQRPNVAAQEENVDENIN
jgi:hypothetical protein